MKKCTYCGYDVEDDSKFCHKCGKKVKKKVKRNVVPLWICFTVIGILFGGLFVIYLFLQQPNEMREDAILKLDNIPDNYLYMDEFTDKPIVNQETALEAVEDVAEMIGIKNVNDELTIHSECTAFDNTFYRFEQEYQGIPVYGRTVIIEADKNGQSLGLSSNYYDVTGVDTNVTYREEDVKEVLTSIYGEDAGWLNEGLVIYSLNREKPELSWRFLVNPDANMEYCFVSAQNGEMIAREPLVYYETVRGSGKDIDGKKQEFNTLKEGSTYYLRDEERNISVFNANGERLEECIVYEDYNGNVYYHDQKNKRFINKDGEEVKIVLDEARKWNIVYDMQGNILSDGLQHVGLYLRTKGLNPFANIEEVTNSSAIWKDKKAVTVISRVSDIHDFYKEVLSRNGFNNENGEVKVVYNNNVFLDNDNASSKYGSDTPFTLIELRKNNAILSVDVIAHEYTHSVENSISNMTYKGESGALKEAYSDIFGEIIQDWCDNRKLDNSCDWIILDRILSNPEKNKYPCFYKGKYWCNTTDVSEKNDWGGVHKNSTVISYAAYLMNCGIDDSNQYEKLGTDKLAELFYSALLSKLQKNCDFQQFRTIVYHRALTMQKQERLTEKQVACVDKAFDIVGIYREDDETNPIEEESGEPEGVPNLPEESTVNDNALFEKLPSEFVFTSGAGGWATLLYVENDGTFYGQYYDSDLGDSGVGYPNGTMYISDFSGKFSTPIKYSDYIYEMTMDSIDIKGIPDTVNYENDTRYIISEPYGLEDANKLYIYLPGAPLEELPEEFLSWASLNKNIRDTLPEGFYGIYNSDGETGFVGIDDCAVWQKNYSYNYQGCRSALWPSYSNESGLLFWPESGAATIELRFRWSNDNQTEFRAYDTLGSGDYKIVLDINDDSSAIIVTITSDKGVDLTAWGGTADGHLVGEYVVEEWETDSIKDPEINIEFEVQYDDEQFNKYASDNLIGKIERISATSYLSESNMNHIPEFATDGDINTAWVEGVEGQGIGEKLTIAFNDTSYVSGFVINAGYQKSEKLYKKNSRPKSLKVMFSDGEMEEFVLDDIFGEQEFYFKTPRNATFVSFTISSVYPGEVYEDTVISEIILR